MPPTKLLFFPPDCFFPQTWRAGSLVAAGLSRGLGEGLWVGSENKLSRGMAVLFARSATRLGLPSENVCW